MRLLRKCGACSKKRLFVLVKKRVTTIPLAGKVTSKEPLCSSCNQGVKALERLNKNIRL